MSSARSNVSKSSSKALWAVLPGVLSGTAIAQTSSAAPVTSASSWVPVLLSLLLVIGVIFALAFLVRRFTGLHSSHGQIRSVASLMVGTRERIAVIQVGKEQHLIGVTPHNINHLAKLDEPLTDIATNDKFKSKLAGFMQMQSSTQEK